jgi:hypothetical protein
MAKRYDHKLMIEQRTDQGPGYAVISLRDKTEDPGKSATGTWTNPTSDTSDDKELSFTSSDKDYLIWKWTSDAPGTLIVGVESDQSKSSHKTGDGKWLQALITLSGAKRDATGKFATASASNEGKGKLTYGNRLLKAGDVTWAMVRYER